MSSTIKNIEKGSIASKTILKQGDTILSINGKRIIDVLDYKYFIYDANLAVLARSPDGTYKIVRIKKPVGKDIGLVFDTYLMDKAKACSNRCVFCFVDQLPRGMRKSLYFKDDDARLSFLTGNYITLTNLSDREIQRIIDLRISPINISVHATNPELRRRLLQNDRAGEIMDIMRRFADGGIEMNCQIVCCPGWNDKEELMRSMRELCELYPAVNSVSVVPVGLTKHREHLTKLIPFDKESATETIDMVTGFGLECLRDRGSRIFFCADELYLKAEMPIPGEDEYEGYPQLENGVGIIRLTIEDFRRSLKEKTKASSMPFSIATGVSAKPVLDMLINEARDKFECINGTVYAIKNKFFGETINVTGLITGQDMISQLKGQNLGEVLYIPDVMLRSGENVFLDDISVDDVRRELGIDVMPVMTDGTHLADIACGDIGKGDY